MRIIYFVIIILLMITNISIQPVIAATPTIPTSKGLGCGGGLGPVAEFVCGLSGNPTSEANEKVGSKLNSVLSTIIGFLTVIAGLWFMIQIILAGFQWISAGGDKHKVQTAFEKISFAVIGLVVVVAAWTLIGLIGKIVGLDILNPGAIIPNLGL